MTKYFLEFILNTYNSGSEAIRNAISEFGEVAQVNAVDSNVAELSSFAVSINTDDPTVVFDVCAQFGRIKSVKVSEVKQ
ncbi:MAG: hypothetical protein HZC15_05390 [Candidatus Omnitrophica bacterium]|nr:hypothetical protein [Candidatus Omnitrophota bacterium]